MGDYPHETDAEREAADQAAQTDIYRRAAMLDAVLSAFNVPPMPTGYRLARIRRGRALLVLDGVPVGRVVRKRGGIGRGSWSYTLGIASRMTEHGFRTRAAAAYMAALEDDYRRHPPVQPDANEAVRMGVPPA
jgi:hypothetical protein